MATPWLLKFLALTAENQALFLTNVETGTHLVSCFQAEKQAATPFPYPSPFPYPEAVPKQGITIQIVAICIQICDVLRLSASVDRSR